MPEERITMTPLNKEYIVFTWKEKNADILPLC